jgi:hypothetical protein
MFQIVGKIDGKSYKLKYHRPDGDGADEDYIVSGDDVAVEKLFSESKIDHGLLGLPPEIWSFKEGYLNSGIAAYALAWQFVFDEVLSSANDWEPDDPNAVY